MRFLATFHKVSIEVSIKVSIPILGQFEKRSTTMKNVPVKTFENITELFFFRTTSLSQVEVVEAKISLWAARILGKIKS